MADHSSSDSHSPDQRLLRAAADALRKRRDLDLEIARLVAEPLDLEAPERLRDAQSQATRAGSELDRERSAHDRPVIDPALDDPDPRSNGGCSWDG